jgi:hypothetical protein
MTHLRLDELGDQKTALHISIVNRAPIWVIHSAQVQTLCDEAWPLVSEARSLGHSNPCVSLTSWNCDHMEWSKPIKARRPVGFTCIPTAAAKVRRLPLDVRKSKFATLLKGLSPSRNSPERAP